MEPGDVITRITGHAVENPSDVTSALANGTPGTSSSSSSRERRDVLGRVPLSSPPAGTHELPPPRSPRRAARDSFLIAWYVVQQRREQAAAAFAARR